jgi:hypothetical protein
MSDSQEERMCAFLDTLREMIRHEDGLLHQRLTWMWTLQGILFTAASVLWSKDGRGVALIAGIGLLSCLSIGYSLARGLRAIHGLRILDENQRKELKEDCCLLAPTIGAQAPPRVRWLLPGFFLPWVFGAGWVTMLIVRLLYPGALP